jgi:diacylglycerol kinase
MISPQLGQAALRIILFLVVTSLIMLPFVNPQSAEFVVVIITMTVGILCGAVLFVLVRRQSR